MTQTSLITYCFSGVKKWRREAAAASKQLNGLPNLIGYTVKFFNPVAQRFIAAAPLKLSISAPI
ncbi:MAG: hypothetical protein A2Z01_01985 [Betaproteobacteria bacterium RBG_16_58_11]|nr:MAG: hypothetical protein A2Z01_01985 [Betaproteobacteria bacterium RBG_16_58_11]